MDKPTMFYLPVMTLPQRNGVNIDLFQPCPTAPYRQEDLFRMIDSGAYPMEALQAYKKMYPAPGPGPRHRKNHRAYSAG